MHHNIMLVGCGPHARRVYIPAFFLQNEYNASIKVVVEVEEKELETREFISRYSDNIEYFFVNRFRHPRKLPKQVERKLNYLVKKYNITGIVISTNPLNHIQYALWAERKGLHILMDKPISTRPNIANSKFEYKDIIEDFNLLIKNRKPAKAFIVNTQRRYNPGFQIVFKKIDEIASRFYLPITSIQSYHCDGQWRLPGEILTQDYHPYYGWGKISRSGYHFTDIIGQFVLHSYLSAGKKFDNIKAYSSFIRPSGILKAQGQRELSEIFGEGYNRTDSRSDLELCRLYKRKREAETDVGSVITLIQNKTPITNISLNLMHTGFSRRNWMLPGEDLYKGNGRIKHEFHNIEQGPLQTIQIHSYQSKSKHEKNDLRDYELGGNNHLDIIIYRNSAITGGKTIEKITSVNLAEKYNYKYNKLFSEQVKKRVVEEFLQIVAGTRDCNDTISDLSTHTLSVELMSMLYESGVKNKVVKHKWKNL